MIYRHERLLVFRVLRLACAGLLAIASLLILQSTTAHAEETRPFTGVSFGPNGAGGTQSFTGIRSIAVDQASGDVFVLDNFESGTIYKFSASGAPVKFADLPGNAIQETGVSFGPESQLAIAPPGSPGGTAGDIYLANNSIVKVFSAGGTELGTLGEGETCGVAVNPAGHIFVGSFPNTIREYVPSANPPANSPANTGNVEINLCNVAADGAGAIYATNYSGGRIAKLAGISDTSPLLIEPGASTIGVDPVSNNLFGDSKSLVAEYDPSGSLLATFGANQLSESQGVAINSAADEVYVGDNGSGKVKVFGEFAVAPDVKAEAATELTGKKATLNGTINPHGLAVEECEFEYGSSPSLGESTACSGSIPVDQTDHPVSAALTGLSPASTYYFRIRVKNANGIIVSPTTSFATLEPAQTEAASPVTPETATLNGTVRPEGEAVEECHFEYSEGGTYTTVDCEQAVPTDQTDHAVTAEIGGLKPEGALYFYRLVIKRGGTEYAGQYLALTTKGLTIGQELVSNVGETEATVEASINPHGGQTSYRFEYGTDTGYGSTTEEAILGEGESFVPAAETLSDLSPGTTYHWRVVAKDPFSERFGADRTFTTRPAREAPETGCPNQAFRQNSESEGLPDCRAYELASPADKHGGSIQGSIDVVQASANGERITFKDVGGLPTTGGASSEPFYFAGRHADGWSGDGLLPVAIPGRGATQLGWDEEIRTGVSNRTLPGVNSELVTYHTSDAATQVIGPGRTEALAGFAEDPDHFIVEGEQLAGTPLGIRNVYDVDHDTVTLAGRIPQAPATTCDDSGASQCIPAPEGSIAGPYDVFEGFGSTAGNKNEGGAEKGYYTTNTISKNGSEVFFTSVGDAQLYLREDGTRTTQVSASQATTPDPNGEKPALFLWATPSGSKVFFSSCARLTDDSTAVSTAADVCGANEPAEQGSDLYVYEPGNGHLEDLTVDHNPADVRGSEVVGMVGASADGAYVYFVANGVLAEGESEGATPGSCSSGGFFASTSGTCNLYAYHDGSIKFIAPLDTNVDGFNWISKTTFSLTRESRVASDGDLLFSSNQDLTNSGNGCVASQEAGCREIYRYSPTDSAQPLICVSCNPSGAAHSDSALTESLRGTLGPAKTEFLTRNISPDGNRIFFDSPDRLVNADRNDVNDPYEWEAAGTGSCKVPNTTGGCLYLLSTGTSTNPTYFGDASVSGDDVFVFTNQSLVPIDKDELVDVYDVKVGGGLSSQNPPQNVLPCESGEACKSGSSSTAPPLGKGTATFVGPGNPKPSVKKNCRHHGKKCPKKKKPKQKHRKGKHQKGAPGKSGSKHKSGGSK